MNWGRFKSAFLKGCAMSVRHRITVCLTILAIALQSWLPMAVAAGGPPKLFKGIYASEQPDQVIQILQSRMQQRELGYDELFDLGSAYFLKQQWDKAATHYEGAAARTTSAGQKAAAFYCAAQAQALGKHPDEAESSPIAPIGSCPAARNSPRPDWRSGPSPEATPSKKWPPRMRPNV
jgi:hypothetical protein